MRFRPGRGLPGAPVIFVVAGALFFGGCSRGPAPLTFHENGIGPFHLGMPYEAAVDAVRNASPDAFLAGPGCGDRDEVSYPGRLDGVPVTVMGMADLDVLTEIELNLESPRSAANETECIALRELLTRPLAARYGSPGETVVVRKPVSVEHIAPLGPARLVVRWFPTGRSCYISVVYGPAE
jgi:hypothetical protein